MKIRLEWLLAIALVAACGGKDDDDGGGDTFTGTTSGTPAGTGGGLLDAAVGPAFDLGAAARGFDRLGGHPDEGERGKLILGTHEPRSEARNGQRRSVDGRGGDAEVHPVFFLDLLAS